MSKKIPQCSAVDQLEHEQPPSHCQMDRGSSAALECGNNKAESGQRNRETASSSPESGSLNGDGKRGGKSRRRKKRSSNPDSRPEGKADSPTKDERGADREGGRAADPHAWLLSLQSECASVWFERSVYEQAESRYQRWLAASSNGTGRANPPPAAPAKQAKPRPAAASPPQPAGHRGDQAARNHGDQAAHHHGDQAARHHGNQAPFHHNDQAARHHGNQAPFHHNDQAARRHGDPAPCHHGDQVACHHVVRAVWVNKAAFDQAERRFLEGSAPSVPNSLNLPSPPGRSAAPRTPDEGYQSLAPTPATPVVQHAAATPPSRQSVNGLPRIPLELLRDVWLEKPLYDSAEAAFYQNLYSNNSSKRPSCTSTARSTDHPQSLVEEEEEEEEQQEEQEEEEAAEVAQKQVPAQQGKAEVFHALLPIQEEEEPAEGPDREEVSGVHYLVHPDSERVWLDKRHYDAAESRFHRHSGSRAVAGAKTAGRPEKASVASATLPRDNTMNSVDFLAQEKIWFDKPRYDNAERRFYENLNGSAQQTQDVGANTILQDIARARENIQKSLAGLKNSLSSRGSGQPPLHQQSQFSSSSAADQGEIVSRIKSLELENQSLHKVVEDLRAALSKLECRVAVLEKSPSVPAPAAAPSLPYTNGTASVQQRTSAPAKQQEEDEDEDDDMDLFGSDEDEEAAKLKEQRLKEYAEKKAKKPGIIAKSSILLDVKPWDDETDMARLEECVRSVQADGLLWGSSKLVPVGYGIKKLQIACVVEDDKVGTDLLEEEITKFEDYVQSVDVAAFNKI